MKRPGGWIVAALAVLFLLFPARLLRADFKLLDAIQEFGEKRFVKSQTSRLKTGPLRLHPTLRSSVEYDDNILLQSDDPRDDVVFNIKPGVILELPIQRHQIAAGYEAEFEVFTKDSRQNDQNQNFFALADLNFPSWYVNILEKFSETSSRSGTTFTGRIPRYDQSVNPKIGYRWKRVVFETAFRHFLRDFRRKVDGPLDFHLEEWSEVVYYDLFARLKALAEYQVAQIRYNHASGRDGTFQQVRFGLEGEVLPNITVKVRAGPQFRNYESSARTDFDSWVTSLSVDYQARKDLTLKFAFSREPVEATFQDVNFYKEHSLSTHVEYQMRRQWKLFSGFRYTRHDYGERATVDSQFGYRRDHHAAVEAGVRYTPMEWLELEAAYRFLRRDSNFPDFDYADNRFTLTSTLSY